MARDLLLGRLRAGHGVEQVAALLLQAGQPLGIRLLAEGGARASRRPAGRGPGSTFGVFASVSGGLRRLDALLGGVGLALQLGKRRRRRWTARARSGRCASRRSVSSRFWASLGCGSVCDLGLVLQRRRARPCAGGRLGRLPCFSVPSTPRSSANASTRLASISLALASSSLLWLGVLRHQPRALGLEARQLVGQRDLLAWQGRSLAALRGGDALLLLG